MEDVRTARPLRLRYATPVWVGSLLVMAGAALAAMGATRFGPVGIVPGALVLTAGLVLLHAGRAGRAELRVEGETLVVPGLVWGESRVPLVNTDAVSLEPPEDPQRLRVMVSSSEPLVVWRVFLQGGERSLREIAIAVIRGSKALRRERAAHARHEALPAGVTPRPG